MTKLDEHRLDNGLVILGERMDHVQSVAFTFRLACGEAVLPTGCCGAGSVIADWIFRGAGERDSRALVSAMDDLGLHRHSSVTAEHLSIGAALEASNLPAALELYADVVLRPRLQADQFAPARELVVQEVLGLDDDPRQKVGVLVTEQFYPDPWGRPTMGRLDDLQALTPEQTRAVVRDRFNIGETVFAVAGRYDFEAVCRLLEDRFGAVAAGEPSVPTAGDRGPAYRHAPYDGAQVHLGLMTPICPPGSEDYYEAAAAVAVLAGSMSSRLFTEVREKRGLCYAVGARYHAMKGHAGVRGYAGTTPAKAQETLDVVLAEFARLREGVSEDEVARAKVGLKSGLIMQSESTGARAGGIAGDYHLLGRVRSLEEIKQALERVTAARVNGFLERQPFEDFVVATIGAEPVQWAETNEGR